VAEIDVAYEDVIALLPLLVTAISSLVVLLLAAFYRSHRLAAGITSIGLTLGLATLPVASEVTPRPVTSLLVVDAYAVFYMGLLLSASVAITGLSYGYLRKREGEPEEFYVVLLLATLGAMTLATATHFASFFLGLELLSVALYVLIAYARTDKSSLEAGLKYLILSGTSSAFLLFGMALLYFASGTMAFAGMASALGQQSGTTLFFLVGLALMLTGIGFKLAVVPFHMWAPDVYQGAPAPVAAFVATVSKGAMFALVLRYFTDIDALDVRALWWSLAGIAAFSMFVGNLLGLLQDNVKRLLAYSSISHLGYMLVALLAGGPLAVEAVSVYLVVYFITTIGAFGVVSLLSDSAREADSMEDYRALFWRRPWIAGIFSIMLLSLAGIPLTAGFIGKFYVIAAGADSSLWLLLVLLAINSVIGLFYYLRLIVAMSADLGEAAHRRARPPLLPIATADGLVLAALSGLLLWIGLFPSPLIRLVQIMEKSLLG